MKARSIKGSFRFAMFRRRPGHIRTVYLDDEDEDTQAEVIDLGYDAERDTGTSGYRRRR